MYAPYIVVDTRDGAVFWKGYDGELFTEETARAFTSEVNSAYKPEHRTYRVFAVLPTLGEPLPSVTITRLEDD